MRQRQRQHPQLNLNNSHRFLPRTLVLGSPFYNTSETFQTSIPLTPTIVEEFVTSDFEIHENKHSRAITISNLNPNLSLPQLISLIPGQIENSFFQNNNLVILFIDSNIANSTFHHLINLLNSLKQSLNSPQLLIEKSPSQPIQSKIQNEINLNGATRSISISNIPHDLNETEILNILSNFGTITSFQLIHLHNSALISFSSIMSAIKCSTQLPLSNSKLSNCKILYSNLSPQSLPPSPSTTTTTSPPLYLSQSSYFDYQFTNLENRCIYIGNLHRKTTIEDICNVIRGGSLEEIKIISRGDKNIAFVKFLNHKSAADLISRSFIDPLFINSQLVKLGWGKNPGPLNPIISLSYSNSNASRNLYIGIDEELETVDDYDLIPLTFSESEKLKLKLNRAKPDLKFKFCVKSSFDSLKFKKIYKCIPDIDTLRRDFSFFGEIEQINYFNNNACAFINFTNILNCINAVEQFNNPLTRLHTHKAFDGKYEKFKIFYGKDRCANPPKKKRIRRADKKNSNNNNNNNNRSQTSEDTIYSIDNCSLDSNLAIRVDSAIDGIGISSPSAHRKVKEINESNNDTGNSIV